MNQFAARDVTANVGRQLRLFVGVYEATRVSERPLRSALEATAGLVHVALALVMAGTGDLAVLRRLRAVWRHHSIVLGGSFACLAHI